MMIGTTVYELTSFEIILGGIFMYVMGVISVIVLFAYVLWSVGNKVEKESEKSKNTQDDYVVE